MNPESPEANALLPGGCNDQPLGTAPSQQKGCLVLCFSSIDALRMIFGMAEVSRVGSLASSYVHLMQVVLPLLESIQLSDQHQAATSETHVKTCRRNPNRALQF